MQVAWENPKAAVAFRIGLCGRLVRDPYRREKVSNAIDSFGSDDEEGYEAHAVDPDAAERLWHVLEEMVGERFDFGP